MKKYFFPVTQTCVLAVLSLLGSLAQAEAEPRSVAAVSAHEAPVAIAAALFENDSGDALVAESKPVEDQEPKKEDGRSAAFMLLAGAVLALGMTRRR